MIFSGLEKLELIPISFKSILKTRRRAFALLAGIILCTMILTGISLYTTVLKEKNYESIVGGTAFEITFDIFNGENFESLTNLGKNITAEYDEVVDFAVWGSVHSNERNSILRATMMKLPTSDSKAMEPTFVDIEQFSKSEIGLKVFRNGFEGIFDLNNGNKTILPREIANQQNLQIGDIIHSINFSQTVFLGQGRTDVAGSTLQNIEVVGIYDSPSTSSLISEFGDDILFEDNNPIFSESMLNGNDYLSEVGSLMRKNGNFQLGIKIDASKFSVSDPELMSEEVDQLINRASLKFGANDVVGKNHIAVKLFSFQLISVFLNFLYIMLSIPIIFLSLYVLIYGLEMSLDERRKDVAIKKVQGASKKQIFRELRNETLLILLIGMAIGYILGILSAYLLGNSNGFLRLNFSGQDFLTYLNLDFNSILISFAVIGIVLIVMIYKKGNAFISEEVSEGMQKYVSKKEGFVKRNKIDIILFGFGFAGALVFIYQEITLITFDSLLLEILTNLSPLFLWIGGALIGARIAKLVPLKLEGIYLSLTFFKDVSRMIKSGLRRRGEVDKLAIILILTLSIASLSAIQGNTDSNIDVRTRINEVGADYQVLFDEFGNYSTDIDAIDGVNDVLPLYDNQIRILSSNLQIASFDIEKELTSLKSGSSIINWDINTFGGISPQQALEMLQDNPMGIFTSDRSLFRLGMNIGNFTSLNVNLVFATENQTQASINNVEILGIINVLPGGYSQNTIFTSDLMMQRLFALSLGLNEEILDGKVLPSLKYLVKVQEGFDINEERNQFYQSEFSQIPGYLLIFSTYANLERLETEPSGFGITGLMTLDFIVSIFAAWITAFAFSSIIMAKRKREFAVLRALGGRKSQIYKLALGENGLMMIATVVWGTFIGILLSYAMNPMFGGIIGDLLKPTNLRRLVVIPWDLIIAVDIAVLLGMFGATLLAIRDAVNADMSIATREE